MLLATLLAAAVVPLLPTEGVEATHGGIINGEWTCYGGGLEIGGAVLDEGDCYFHWSYADNAWHHLSEVPTAQRNAISPGVTPWESGHALNFVYDSGSPSHVHWTSSAPCSIACTSGVTIVDVGGTPNDHIETFQVYFNSSQTWNTNGSASHGSFSGWDLKSVATHEWGRTAGFGHSITGDDGHSGYNNSAVATMCTPGSTCLPQGHTEYRDLHADDIEGRCQVYYHAHGYSC